MRRFLLVPIFLLFAVDWTGGIEQTDRDLYTTTTDIPVVHAEREVIRDVFDESRVDTTAQRPGVAAYAFDVVDALQERLRDMFRPLVNYSEGFRDILVYAARAAMGLALLLPLAMTVRFLLRRSRRVHTETDEVVTEGHSSERRRRGSAEWRREIELRLNLSDIGGSLEATWWWLACNLVGLEVLGSWTNGELLEKAGRGDLTSLVDTLDRLRFGIREPTSSEIRQLVAQLDRVLA